jgi:hypothetical protein
MKVPYDSNYELMKLPYSTSEFPTHLMAEPPIPSLAFHRYEDNTFMFWPSSWIYPEGLLRDAFGVLTCLSDQRYRTTVAITIQNQRKVRSICQKKGIPENVTLSDLSEKEEKLFELSWNMAYSFHEFEVKNDFIRTNYYKRNKPLSDVSQGPEVSCLKPQMFDTIQGLEYEFETRILQPFQYVHVLFTDFLFIDLTTVEWNILENDERTLEVMDRESRRKTPMKPRW